MRLLLALVVVFAATDAVAQRVTPPELSQTAITETLGFVGESDGWCVATNGVTTVDLSAAAPVRLTTVIRSRIRYVSLRFIAGATSVRACTKLGSATTLQANACLSIGANSAGLLTDGQVTTYAVGRDFRSGTFPALTSQANAGTDGFVCVGVAW